MIGCNPTPPGIDPGLHYYAYTWVTGAGESLPSPAAAVTLSGPRPALTPGPALDNESNPFYVCDLPIGAVYTYAFAFSSADKFNDLTASLESALSVTTAIQPPMTTPITSATAATW